MFHKTVNQAGVDTTFLQIQVWKKHTEWF